MLSVLLVEDDDEVRACTAEMLRELGHQVVEASNAEQAMTLLRGSATDVLVADVGLPGMSGDVFAAEARTIRPAIGIVFATGLDGLSSAGGGAGAPLLLRKPYDVAGLAAALQTLQATRISG